MVGVGVVGVGVVGVVVGVVGIGFVGLAGLVGVVVGGVVGVVGLFGFVGDVGVVVGVVVGDFRERLRGVVSCCMVCTETTLSADTFALGVCAMAYSNAQAAIAAIIKLVFFIAYLFLV